MVFGNSVIHLGASRTAGNFLNIEATTSCCCCKTMPPPILACSNGDTARTTGLIGLQRSSCFCHSHFVMNFTSSSTELTKNFLRGWTPGVWGNATRLKQMPCLLKTQATIISRHVSVSLWGFPISRTIRRYTVEINPMLLRQWTHNLLLSNGCTLPKPFQELLQQARLDRVTNACFLYMYAHYPLLHYALPYYISGAFQQSQKKAYTKDE